ncbi:MAG: hypothetical protein WAX69_16885 [Victivallales bacterium]
MIQILDTKTGSAPIIVCDHCGKRIDDAEDAAVIMPDTKRHPNKNRRAIHVHKGDCHDAVEASEGGNVGWEEMTRHIRLLMNNLKITTEQLEKEGKNDTEFGITNK